MSDLVGNPEDLFSQNEVQMMLISAFVFAIRVVQNFKPLSVFYCCTARFVSDLVGNPEDRFSHNEVHIIFYIHSCFDLDLKKIMNYVNTPMRLQWDFAKHTHFNLH